MSPKPPYYAVIFSSRRNADADEVYATTSQDMFTLASHQPGYLGHESARDSESRQGITVTYWDSLDNIKRWKAHAEHVIVQKMGRDVFYEEYQVKVAKVEREYRWTKSDNAAGCKVADEQITNLGIRRR
jgi:heme-degrading monooxygenase HmoA